MHDDYTPRYLTYLIARLYEQIEDKSTIEILTKYLDYTEDEAKEALENVEKPELFACDDRIGAALLNAEESGDKQDVFNVLDGDFKIFNLVINYDKNNRTHGGLSEYQVLKKPPEGGWKGISHMNNDENKKNKENKSVMRFDDEGWIIPSKEEMITLSLN